MSGLTAPSWPLPRLENDAIVLVLSNAPDEYVVVYEPGVFAVAQDGPELPLANAGKMPAATQVSTTCEYQGSKPDAPPHELFTMSGARSGSGLFPSRSV